MSLNNFESDDHALITGYVMGLLGQVQFPAYHDVELDAAVDADGDYLPAIEFSFQSPAGQRVSVTLTVGTPRLPAPPPGG